VTTRQQIVVITGASGGVGRATAVRFGAAGAAVALLARDEQGLAEAAKEVRHAGGKVMTVVADVANSDEVDAAAERVEASLGPIDVWVNCAMVTVFSPFPEMTTEEFRRVTEVTYLGAVHGTRAALRHMRERDRGSIVQVGSALSYRAIPLQSAYCGAKFAMRGFTDAVRTELMHEKSRVRITMVQLPACNTPQFEWARHRLPHRPQPVPPIYQPEVAARAIYWAAHQRRRELWVGWSSVKAIVGTLAAPGFTDWLMARKAVDGQFDQAAPPPEPHRPDNLFAPVSGLHAPHGRFSGAARDRSRTLWVAMHRRALVGTGLVVGLCAWAIAALF